MAADEVGRRWSAAFARQALSDKLAYDAITRAPLPRCHQLHQLQMVLEKLCKARMWVSADPGTGQPDFFHSHKVIVKVLPNMVKEHCRRTAGTRMSRHQISELQAICREIEFLAPAVDDDGRRLDNCEYPWAAIRGGRPHVETPCDWSFRITERLKTPMGRVLLKTSFAICEDLGRRKA